MKRVPISMNMVDKVVSYFSPMDGLKRVQGRMAFTSLEDSGYVTPKSSRKSMRGANVRAQSPNQDTTPKIADSRALSRDLYMNTPIMAGLMRRMNTNVIGAGLLPQPQPDAHFLGLSTSDASDWVRTTQRKFNLWASSKQASWTANHTFWDMQSLAFLSAMMNGDCFFATPWKASNDPYRTYELRVRLIEGDLIRNPVNIAVDLGVVQPGQPDILGGVEYRNGELFGYWMGDNYPSEYRVADFTFIPTYDANGRPQIFQIAAPERIGQRRGMPFMASVLEAMKQLSRLSEAELMSALVSSFFTVFIKDQSGMGGLMQEGYIPGDTAGGGGGEGPDAEQLPKQFNAAFDLEMGYGNINYLDDDKEIQLADPKKTDDGFSNFFDALVTQIAAAGEMSKSQLMLQFSASYSASRGEIMETWKAFRTKRAWFARQFNQPIYEAFLEESVIKGYIIAPGFLSDPEKRAAWSLCQWVGPGMGHLDPLKEANAAVVKIKNNLSTYEDEFSADSGGSWSAAMERRAREKEQLSVLGLPDPGLYPPPGITSPLMMTGLDTGAGLIDTGDSRDTGDTGA